jgi:hypothetical protein
MRKIIKKARKLKTGARDLGCIYVYIVLPAGFQQRKPQRTGKLVYGYFGHNITSENRGAVLPGSRFYSILSSDRQFCNGQMPFCALSLLFIGTLPCRSIKRLRSLFSKKKKRRIAPPLLYREMITL